jgi:hypothetical protein
MEFYQLPSLCITHLCGDLGRGCEPAVLNTDLAQCSLIESDVFEKLVAVVAVVEVIGEPGVSEIDVGISENTPEEGDNGDVGDRCAGRVRSYDLRRDVFRSSTGLGGSAALPLEEGLRLSDIRSSC